MRLQYILSQVYIIKYKSNQIEKSVNENMQNASFWCMNTLNRQWCTSFKRGVTLKSKDSTCKDDVFVI